MTSSSSFELFPLLPFELRLKIWHLVLSTPRVVTISCEREKLDRERRFAKSFVSTTRPPALLHVCSETRSEGLSIYTPHFKTDTSPIYTYISFENDTVQCPDSVLEYMGEEEVQRVQRMILDVRDSEYFGHFHMDVIKRMSKLMEVSLLAQDGQLQNWYRAGRFVERLVGDFEEGRYSDPGWECPRVRILNKNTGEELRVFAGGALIPGYKPG
jgi:hypothetical protein